MPLRSGASVNVTGEEGAIEIICCCICMHCRRRGWEVEEGLGGGGVWGLWWTELGLHGAVEGGEAC